jgi:hypothetical protein
MQIPHLTGGETKPQSQGRIAQSQAMIEPGSERHSALNLVFFLFSHGDLNNKGEIPLWCRLVVEKKIRPIPLSHIEMCKLQSSFFIIYLI